MGVYLSTSGDLVSWNALDEGERAFYAGPMAEAIVEHVCRYWSAVVLTELYFQNDWYCPDVP